MRRLVAVAGQPAIFLVQLGDLNGTAPLFVTVLPRVRPAPAGMREVKQKRTVAAHHHVAMIALGFVVQTLAGTGDEIVRLLFPMAPVVGTKNAEPLPFVNDHPELIVPAKTFRPFTAAWEGKAFVRPRREIGTFGEMDGF